MIYSFFFTPIFPITSQHDTMNQCIYSLETISHCHNLNPNDSDIEIIDYFQFIIYEQQPTSQQRIFYEITVNTNSNWQEILQTLRHWVQRLNSTVNHQ